MREIKFRAWDKEAREWDHSDNILKDFESAYSFFCSLEDKEVSNNIVLMQYTGMKDKGGNEIYEGDIVRVDNEWEAKYAYEVEFGTGAFDSGVYKFQGWHCGRDHSAQDVLMNEDVLIIGNIYENPELLKEGK